MTIRRIAALAGAVFALTAQAASAETYNSGRRHLAMADGTELAVWVQFPQGYDGHSALPAIFEYDGYDGGIQPSYYAGFLGTNKDYVSVHAGVRGAGCSGGDWSLFSQQQAADGAALVEWIARQPWSDGDVGIYGHSYSATMGLLTAARRPPHLRAVTVDGVLDDLYRDLVYPGGVANSGFPILWLAASRPEQEHQGTVNRVQAGDYDCVERALTRNPIPALIAGSPAESAYVQGELGFEDNQWWRSVSPGDFVDRITVPVQITGGAQDEQTLSRGPGLMFQQLEMARKQLLLTNGDHNSFWQGNDRDILDARKAWLDRYVRGIRNGIDRAPRVKFLLEGHAGKGGIVHTGAVGGHDFPLGKTQWQRFYADAGHTLVAAPPKTAGSDVYAAVAHRSTYDTAKVLSGNGDLDALTSTDGPDQALYRSAPFTKATAVAGPLVATLWAKLTAPDAEFYVRVADEAPDGSVSMLNRGYLKASHRAVDRERSSFDGDVMYRPWHPHTGTTTALVTPGKATRYDIEVWPVETVLRPGHRLVMIVSAPPVQDVFDTYQPRTAPQAVRIMHDAQHPTNLLVPLLAAPKDLGPAVACGQQVAVRCFHK